MRFSICERIKGGPAYFAGRLAAALEHAGHRRVHSTSAQDIRIGIAAEDVEAWHGKGVPVLLRMDGICHRSDMDFIKENSRIAEAFHKADGIVFQTEFSRMMCRRYLGEPEANVRAVVINGFDVPEGFVSMPHPAEGRPFAFTAAQWRPHKRLYDTIRGFLEWGNPDALLFVAGADELPVRDTRAIPIGFISESRMLPYYRHSLAFLHLCWIDWCPNTVVEAIACGTPVICTSNGGTREIVRDSGVVICEGPYGGEPCRLYEPPPVPPRLVAEALESVSKGGFNLNRPDVSMKSAAKKYEALMERVIDEAGVRGHRVRRAVLKEQEDFPTAVVLRNVHGFIDRGDSFHASGTSIARAESLMRHAAMAGLEMILDCPAAETLRLLAPEASRLGLRPFFISGQHDDMPHWRLCAAMLFRKAQGRLVRYGGLSFNLGVERDRKALMKSLEQSGSESASSMLVGIAGQLGFSKDEICTLDPDMLPPDEAQIDELVIQGWVPASKAEGGFVSGMMKLKLPDGSIKVFRCFDAANEIAIRSLRRTGVSADASELKGTSPVADGICHLDGCNLSASGADGEGGGGGLRVAVLCGPDATSRRIANEISMRFDLASLVVESRCSEPMLGRVQGGWRKSVPDGIEFESEEQARVLGEESLLFLASPWAPAFVCDNLANPALEGILKELAPDVIVMHGAGVPIPWLDSIPCPKYTLLPGLAPKYCGFKADIRALFDRRPDLIGCTVRQYSSADAGSIVDQARPELDGSETVHGIELKSAMAGLESIIRILEYIESSGLRPPVMFQETDAESWFSVESWTPSILEQVEESLDSSLLFNMRKKLEPAKLKGLQRIPEPPKMGSRLVEPKSPPAVSVVMGVRDGGAQLSFAIESILAQTFRYFEFIIVDDGSTDSTPETIAEYARRDPRIKSLRLDEGGGLAKALNHGIRNSSGAFIARQDADDISLKTRLAAQIEYLKANPECAVCGTQICRGASPEASEFVLNLPKTPLECRVAMLSWGGCHVHGSLMMRRETLEGCGLYDESLGAAQDYDLLLRLSASHPTANLSCCHYFYREHGGQVSTRKSQLQHGIMEAAMAHSYEGLLSGGGEAAKPLSAAAGQSASSLLAAFMSGRLNGLESIPDLPEPPEKWNQEALQYFENWIAESGSCERFLDGLGGAALPVFLARLAFKSWRPGMLEFMRHLNARGMKAVAFPGGRFCRRWLPMIESAMPGLVVGWYDDAADEPIGGMRRMDAGATLDSEHTALLVMAESDAGLVELRARRLFPALKTVQALALEGMPPDMPLMPASAYSPEPSSAEGIMWMGLVENFFRKLRCELPDGTGFALFGAGTHTRCLLPVLSRLSFMPELIFDDSPRTSSLMGCPIVESSKAPHVEGVEALVISSDSSRIAMREAVESRPELFGSFKVFDIYGTLPERPFIKD